jgi:hypothetical protein
MADFMFRGVPVEDTWPTGARCAGSQTRHQWHRREDGSQRWLIHLPTGEPARFFTQDQARAVIRLLRHS